MNPGEQNQNPFRRPGTTTTGSQNGAPVNRSRYFGGRSRYQGNRTSSTNQPNPQGFVNPFSQPQQQPVAPIAPAPAYAPTPERKSHKKRNLLIAGGVIAVVAIIVTLIVTTIKITDSGIHLKGTNHSLADLQTILEKYGDNFREAWLQNVSVRDAKQVFPHYSKAEKENSEIVKRYEDKRTTIVDALKKFSDELEQFGDIDINGSNYQDYDINHDLAFLKETVKKIAVFYEKYINTQIAIIQIYEEDASSQSIDNLKNIIENESLNELANIITEKIKNRKMTEAPEKLDELYDKALNSLSIDEGEETSPTVIISKIRRIKLGEQNENEE